ncbi:RNA-directed DNA polymerase, eukaryota, reverse transcriptase zinc-binding domain protein, partial [Tanacetum coccineum]
DFNVSLKVEEHSNGSSTNTNEMNEFLEVIQDIEVEEILSSGFHYTWTKSRMNPKCKTLKKLDRIMINEDFIEKFPSSHGIFMPYLISDHSLAVLKIPKGMVKRKKSFRFSNFVTEKKEFLPIVKRVWDTDIDGHMMYKVVKKLKLKESQVRVNSNPHDKEIKDESGKILNEYYEALKDENSLLMQKAKIEYSDEAFCLSRDVNEVEVKNAMFDINHAKAPGPDGYTTRFYKSAWSIIGKDICKAVQEFFIKGKLLGEVNATLISLVSKMQNPNKVFDFRPISCCNVIYMCISKIVTNRIKGVLGKLVNKSQSAFIAGR